MLPIEEAGDEEQHSQHHRDQGVRACAEVELDSSIHRPHRASHKPDPGIVSHRILDADSHLRRSSSAAVLKGRDFQSRRKCVDYIRGFRWDETAGLVES